MSDRTQISWTDATWSPVTGCTKVSEGCLNCYIERTPPFRMERRRFDLPVIGGTTGVRLHPERLDKPKEWRKPRRIFVCSMADLFHEDVPDGYIAQVFAVMANAKHHVFQVLTKRPARMRSLLGASYFPELVTTWAWRMGIRPATRLVEFPLPNVWLGVSVESQKWADVRIPLLLDTPAAVRWLSCEPLLGPVDLRAWLSDDPVHFFHRDEGINWVVVGGESGPGKGIRPMHPDWARSLRDQCVAAGVPFHFKQWGEWGPAPWSIRVCDPKIGWTGTAEELAAAKADAEARGATHAYASWAHEHGHELYEPPHKPWSLERADDLDGPHAPMRRWGKKRAGRELDGRTWDQYPAEVFRGCAVTEDYTTDEDLNEVLNRNREEMADEDWRLLQFHALVPDAPGQVGSLLRMIAHVHDEFAKSKAQFGTTHGEENRIYSILDEAMSTLEWLRAGESR